LWIKRYKTLNLFDGVLVWSPWGPNRKTFIQLDIIDVDHSEDALISRCQSGDTDAFGVLAKKYAGRAIGTASMFLGCHHDAHDASQEAFVRAWRGIKKFNSRSSFYTWYSTILRNVCISRLRKKSNKAGVELHENLPGEASRFDPSLLAERNERTERLWRAIMKLPDIHREIIVMSHFQHLSYKEIAELLEIPIGTIASRLHSARKALRKFLEPQSKGHTK